VKNLNLGIDYNGNKGFRLLSIYERLNKGEAIERDIDDLRAYLAETHMTENEVAIKYDKTRNVYYLARFEREWLTNEEVMALCKILLESRAFCKEELNGLISKLLTQVVPNDRKKIESMIRNELHHYVPLQHKKHLFSILWELSQFITNNEIIQFDYTRQDGITKNISRYLTILDAKRLPQISLPNCVYINGRNWLCQLEITLLLAAYKAGCYAAEHRQDGQIFWQLVQVLVYVEF